ncbi:MAG TPA: CPBP family intramembrane glutamic endopeptidase [Anaeromyxobacter sp.]|nr:CPBP family intramembrane glutamic endopeptidase [Anaeromyxobacter sp.]
MPLAAGPALGASPGGSKRPSTPPAGPVKPWPEQARPAEPVRPRVWTAFLAVLASQVGAGIGALVVVFAVLGTAVAAGSGRPDLGMLNRVMSRPGVFLVLAGLGALASGAVALAAAWLGREPAATRLGLVRGAAGGGSALLAAAGALGLALTYGALTSALKVRPAGPSALIERAVSAAAGPGREGLGLFLLAVVCLALVPPLCEEMLFRGYVQRRLVQRWGPAGVVVTAFLFGLVHLDRLQSPHAFLLGLFLGWVTLRAGSIRPAIVAHTAVNGWAVVAGRLGLADGMKGGLAVRAAVGLAAFALALALLARRPALAV